MSEFDDNPDRAGAHHQIAVLLRDAHSIEQHALVQVRQAPRMLNDDVLAEIFTEHLGQTGQHEYAVRARLEELSSGRSVIKDFAGTVGGWGMALLARVQPDTPGTLIAYAYSCERLEQAAYELLELIAEQDGDDETAALARTIGAQETAMAERIAAQFERAVELSLVDAVLPDGLDARLDAHLADVHAIEAEGMQLLGLVPALAHDRKLAAALRCHRSQTRSHIRLVEECLDRRCAARSLLKDFALRIGAFNLAGFFSIQLDTPLKLAGFAFAFEHLEIAAYELLSQTARRAEDDETAQVADGIADEERVAAAAVRERFPDIARAAAVRHLAHA